MTKLEAIQHFGFKTTEKFSREGLDAIRKTAQSKISRPMERQSALVDIAAANVLLASLDFAA